MARSTVVVLGGSGLVGGCLTRRWVDRAEIVAPSHAEVDVLDSRTLGAFLEHSGANTLVNLVAWADVDGAEPERGNTEGTVYGLNVEFPGRLAEQCRRLDVHLIHVSTDYVFDGTKVAAPYVEADSTRGLCWYAETKLRGEQAVLQANNTACVARIEMPFTGHDHRKRDLARTIVARLEHGQTIQGVTDQRITPVFLDDAAEALWQLSIARYAGLIHVAASSWTTPFDLAHTIAERLQLPRELIVPDTFEHFSGTRAALRPQHSWLDVSHFTELFGAGILRPVHDELDAWTEQWNNATR
ncbi:MAG: NAD(P)-dependent oxidoreductase [Chloroflexi bacterium]|nr:NAD(P)-dependent oxidoreductase [Chloroflexota bacterium]MBV9597503.1 NAD(P)-dependent oxidoreductase [Chloroflexota bacterium]